jgi:hypothetical protein
MSLLADNRPRATFPRRARGAAPRILAANKKASRGGFLASRKIW